jgi:hypothetical protein
MCASKHRKCRQRGKQEAPRGAFFAESGLREACLLCEPQVAMSQAGEVHANLLWLLGVPPAVIILLMLFGFLR